MIKGVECGCELHMDILSYMRLSRLRSVKTRGACPDRMIREAEHRNHHS
jgi:hypothetical protein